MTRIVDPAGAVEVLRAGGLLVIPTETVYGLAADAGDPGAVARIYAVKARPADHPLILHISSADLIDRWAAEVPDYARRMIAAAWPGPLTVVLPRSAAVGNHVTGGQDTVALRVPDHPLTLDVLSRFGGAVAAPSANRFGGVSPTSLKHVLSDLGDALGERDGAMDGGSTRVGIESTIVDCAGPAPRILRPGWFDPDAVERLAGLPLAAGTEPAPRVPGALASHYAPHARVFLAAGPHVASPAGPDLANIGILALAEVPTPSGWVRLSAPENAEQYARSLYAALREADALRLDTVVAIPPPGAGIAAAVRDRLGRAATPGPG